MRLAQWGSLRRGAVNRDITSGMMPIMTYCMRAVAVRSALGLSLVGHIAPNPMMLWPVSTRVNSPENDDPSLVEAVDLIDPVVL
jgi:hypothetical protein